MIIEKGILKYKKTSIHKVTCSCKVIKKKAAKFNKISVVL